MMKSIACLTTIFASLAAVIQVESAIALTVEVNCVPPKSGTYSLGWGTSRLIVQKDGQAYSLFRGNRRLVKDTICQSSDNTGLVIFRADGTVWAYVRVNE